MKYNNKISYHIIEASYLYKQQQQQKNNNKDKLFNTLLLQNDRRLFNLNILR
jgi:hypothetical protein